MERRQQGLGAVYRRRDGRWEGQIRRVEQGIAFPLGRNTLREHRRTPEWMPTTISCTGARYTIHAVAGTE